MADAMDSLAAQDIRSAGAARLDPNACYAALKAKDERFDGRLFVGVTSTGVYCRPVCPASAPKREHCRFFQSAAAAQESGFRPCLRCRPETAPAGGAWRGASSTVSRGLSLIADGALDGETASVESLAEQLGVGARQVRRLFQQHLGASPIAVAQTRRVLFAKQLLHDTRLPMIDVAMAAGFRSVRRFNETFQNLFRRPPSALRRKALRDPRESPRWRTAVETGVTVRLRYRAPYDWDAILAHLAARAIDGVESVEGGIYQRTLEYEGLVGWLSVAHVPQASSLSVTMHVPDVRALRAIVARVRRAFDLDADVGAIGEYLSRDPALAPLVRARPGLRVPGGWDGFELAVRAVLGQQVTIAAARRLADQLVRSCGVQAKEHPTLSRVFPTAAEVVRADLSALGMPRARRLALTELARAALLDRELFHAASSVEATVARLKGVRGIGDWTAHYIALRAAREPDAFPASDVGLLRGAQDDQGLRPTPKELLGRAERWRPWRAYAAQHLWARGTARDAAHHGAREAVGDAHCELRDAKKRRGTRRAHDGRKTP
jgi:AraC family transcriptional regulator of adaptative response / DNA-3-methyladenine glycosylase II